MVYLDGYDFYVSHKKNKKYDVYKNGRFLTSFGAIKENSKEPYEQYFDKIGFFSAYNNLNKKKKKLYKNRHKKDIGKKESAGWFAFNYLW